MQPAEHERGSWLRWMAGGVAITAVVVVVLVLLINRAAKDRFDLPVEVYLCGSAIDLSTVEPGVAPTGCVVIPRGIQLTMSDPDKEAHAYKDGFFGFRDIPADSSEATLIAAGAIESSTISMVAIDKNDTSESSEMVAQTDAGGLPEWTTSFRLSSDLKGLFIHIVTSPDSPPINA